MTRKVKPFPAYEGVPGLVQMKPFDMSKVPHVKGRAAKKHLSIGNADPTWLILWSKPPRFLGMVYSQDTRGLVYARTDHWHLTCRYKDKEQAQHFWRLVYSLPKQQRQVSRKQLRKALIRGFGERRLMPLEEENR